MPEAGKSGDIVYQATVDDKTAAYFDKFDARLNQQARKAEQSFTKMESGMRGFANVAGVIGGAVGGVVGTVATKVLDQVLGMANQAKAFLTESANLAARAETLGVVMEVVGKNAGYSKKEMKGFEEGLKETGISILEARDALAKMIQAELKLEDATKVARVAQNAAVILGSTSSDAFQRLLWGITTLQPEILRTMNLSVDFQQEMQKWAAANNRTADSMTMVERRQVAMNAVLKAGEKIAGAYEAAMDTVGKKMGSMVRFTQDFMVMLGEVFLEGMGEKVDWTIEKLKDAQKWIIENEGAIEDLGETVGNVMATILSAIDAVAKALIALPEWVKNVGVDIARIIALVVGKPVEEVEQSRDKIGTYLGQIVVMLTASVVGAMAVIVELAKQSAEALSLVWDVFSGKISPDEFRDRIHQLRVSMIDDFSAAQVGFEAYQDAVITLSDTFGLLEKSTEDTGDATEDYTKKTEDAAAAQEQLQAELSKVETSLDSLYRKMMEDVETRGIQQMREDMEAALRESWLQEDLARKNAEAIADIMEGAEESMKQAAQDYANAKIDIEKNYQRTIRDMQQRFEFEGDELARSRDAIGLLRLIRQHSFELKQAKQNRNDQLNDAEATWQEQRQQIDKQRQQALDDLRRQQQKEYQERQRAAERERQLQQMHDKWEEEDRRRAYAKQIADLLRQSEALRKNTGGALDKLLAEWQTYFGDLLTLATEEMNKVNAITTPGSNQPPGTTSTGGTTNKYGYGGSGGYVPATGSTMGGKVIGQAGIVSHLLANPSTMLTPTGYSAPPVPAVNTSQKGGRTQSEISVKVEGYAFDPYIQRMLANALIEVERNRSAA